MAGSYRDENDVFYNKLGITDAATLHDVEYTVSSSIAESIVTGEIKLQNQQYGLSRLQEIHQNLFGGIYGWAGQIRTFESSKGNRLSRTVTKFEQPESIAESWKEVEQMAERFTTAKGLDFQTAKEQLTDILVKANYTHPFPEGNGRALQVFMTQLAQEQNITMDYSKADPEMWNQANALSVPHFRRFEGHLIPREANRFSLNLLLENVIQPAVEISNEPKQNEAFAKLEKEYQNNQHLLSPFQKQVAAGALQSISGAPSEVQIQAKTHLYTAQLAQLQQSQHRPSEPSTDVEIER